MNEEQQAIEEALDIAIDRTRGAQRKVASEVGAEQAPAVPSTELVVRRADDVRVLVDEETQNRATDDPGAA